MNDIIKKIEAEQLKSEVPQFRVGDTVRVHGKIFVYMARSRKATAKEFRFSRALS